MSFSLPFVLSSTKRHGFSVAHPLEGGAIVEPPKLITRNTTYSDSNRTPSLQLILSLPKKYHKNRLMMSENMTKFEKAAMLTVRGDAINATPRIRVMLMKPLPIMLPSAKSKCPFRAELTLVANSGILVPKATIVAPMTTRGIPALSAMNDDESTMKNAVAITTLAPANAKEAYLRSPLLSWAGTSVLTCFVLL